MKFVIEVDDFYMEGGDLESNLKHHIIRDCVSQITQSLKQKIEDGVNKEVKSQVEQSLYRRISQLTSEIISSDRIQQGYSKDDTVTLQEYIIKQFEQKGRSAAPVDETIKKLANAFGEEMKKRYDLLFASQLVAKMKESGFIKEEAIALLLDK